MQCTLGGGALCLGDGPPPLRPHATPSLTMFCAAPRYTWLRSTEGQQTNDSTKPLHDELFTSRRNNRTAFKNLAPAGRGPVHGSGQSKSARPWPVPAQVLLGAAAAAGRGFLFLLTVAFGRVFALAGSGPCPLRNQLSQVLHGHGLFELLVRWDESPLERIPDQQELECGRALTSGASVLGTSLARA